MKKIVILFLILSILAGFAACRTGAPTTAANLAQPTQPPTTTHSPTTVPPTTSPIMGPTCPPVEGDTEWGNYRGKAFVVPEIGDYLSYHIILYIDGICSYELSPLHSTLSGDTVWTFDGEFLYIGRVETGTYTTLRYIPGPEGEGGKLIFIKSDHDLHHFTFEEDGLEFHFAGILNWPDSN